MRRDYSYRMLRAKQNRVPLFITTLCVAAVLAVDILSGGAFRGALRRSVSVLFTSVPAAHISAYFTGRHALLSENARLKEENAILRAGIAQTDQLRQEYAALESLAKLAGSKGGVSARIASAVRASPYGTYLIAAGREDGVSVGDVVLSEDGTAIGRVQHVERSTALVRDVFAPGAEVEAVVGNGVGVFMGQGGSGYADMPRDVVVTFGAVAYSPELQHAIGIVGAIATSSASATQRVYVRPALGRPTLRFVYVEPASR